MRQANENNIDTKTFHHRSETSPPANDYDYHDLDRFTDVEYLSNQLDVEGFVMDNLGNRTGNQTLRSDGTVNFTVQSSANRYTSIGGNSISHDDAGNLTVDKDGYQYTYDYENRVVKIEDSSNNDVAEYAYDALGRRIRMIDTAADPDVETLYYYNPDWQVLAEYDGSNGLQRYFVYGNYIDEPLVMNDGTDDFYYVQDHLYSTVALVGYIDSAWTVAERYEYDAYGAAEIMDASYNSRTMSSYGNPYTFTGRRLDVLDGGDLVRMHYRHRDYNTYAGMFLQHDPQGINPAGGWVNRFRTHQQFVEGMNLYAYATTKPINATDPLGLFRGGPWVPPDIYPTPAPGDVCGIHVYLYTGEWCVDQDIYNEAVEAAAESIITTIGCIASCEAKAHHCLVNAGCMTGSLFVTHYEVKKPAFLYDRGLPSQRDVTTIQSLLAYAASRSGCTRIGNALRRSASAVSRAPVATAFKIAVKAGVAAEAGILIYCSYTCSQETWLDILF